MEFILWLIAVAIAVYGVTLLVRGLIVAAIVAFVLAALIGPGGVSLFT